MRRPMTGVLASVLAGGLCGAGTAYGQTVALQLENGRVTLRAENASIRDILDRWAEIGQVTVTNAERLPDTRMTIRLDDVPEGSALGVLLRDVAGYMLIRRADSAAAASVDRILIMSPTSAPVPSAALRPRTDSFDDTASVADSSLPPRPAQGFAPAESAAAQRTRQAPESQPNQFASESGINDFAPSSAAAGVYSGEGAANQPTRVTGADAGPAGDSSAGDGRSSYEQIRARDRQVNGAGNVGSATVGSRLGSARPGEISPPPAQPEPQQNRER